MEQKLLFPLNLQLFAEDETPNVENPDTTTTLENDEESKEKQVKSFTQEDIDKIIKGRIAKERKMWEKEYNAKKTEAEKLSSMSEKERTEYNEQKRIDDLNKREAAIIKRELTATAKSELNKLGLPTSLSDLLDYSNAENCKTSIDTVTKAFKEAVQKAVDERIKGTETLTKAKAPNPELTEEERLKKDMTDLTKPLAVRVAAREKYYSLKEDK